MEYVGLDVSLKQTSFCVVNRTGSIVREGVLASDPEAIAGFVRSKALEAVRIGLETGSTATWLWTELSDARDRIEPFAGLAGAVPSPDHAIEFENLRLQHLQLDSCSAAIRGRFMPSVVVFS